jgi:transcriptional antiterminator RfaH
MRATDAGTAVAISHADVAATPTRPIENGARWYLIHCRPRQEVRALENLERQAFECFRPTCRVERVLTGHRREVVEPLFPSYLFIHLDKLNDNWLPIRSTRGVNRIVRFNQHPAPIADALIAQIRRRMAGKPLKEPYLKRGDRVVITEGSFSQVEAIFLSDDGDERVMLLMNILNGEHELSFPLANVRKLTL